MKESSQLPANESRSPDTPPATPPIPHLRLKASLLLLLMLILVFGSVTYLLYARGAFEITQQLVLLADDSEGVSVGMDITFSGFPIGRISRIELSNDGKARMLVDVVRKDAHWLRTSSIFTMERGLVGNTRIRAYSGIPTDPQLQDGAVRTLLVGDASAEIPRLLAAAKELIQNLTTMTSAESPLNASLDNVKTLTGKISGRDGALGTLFGNEKDAQKLITALDRANTLLARLDGLALKTDGLVTKADTRVFGTAGLMNDTQAAIVQMNVLLNDARSSLKKVDAVLVGPVLVF